MTHPVLQFRTILPLAVAVGLIVTGLNIKPRPTSGRAVSPVNRPEAPADSSPFPSPGGVSPELETVVSLQQKYEQLAEENNQLETQLTDVLNWILDNFKGRNPVAETDLPRLQFDGVTEAFTLDERVADFLHIGEQERTRINEAFAYTAAQLKALEHQRAALSLDEAGSILIEIPPFAEEGKQVKDDLHGALASTLGGERAARMKTITSNGMDERFRRFGDQFRTIRIELVDNAAGEPPHLLIQDASMEEQEDGTLTMGTVQLRADQLPEVYREWEPELDRLFEEAL